MTEKHPSITFRLDPRSGLAPYRQLVDQVRNATVSGILREGDQLPSLRDVVTQITINPNTVHRAYRELEHLGIAEGRAGLGTFIKSYSSGAFDATERESLERKLRDTITEARHFGMSEEQILELITLAFRQDRDVRT
jgi:GntR family transcriptional regulator